MVTCSASSTRAACASKASSTPGSTRCGCRSTERGSIVGFACVGGRERVRLAFRRDAVFLELVLDLSHADAEDLRGPARRTADGFHRLEDRVAFELVHC